MTDKYTTKELIEFLGDTIDYLGLYSPDKDGMIHTGFTVNQITKLKRIREILELQAQPDEELVEELLNLFSERAAWILSSAFDCSIPEPEALEDKIRLLLQSRQPVVTREEIDEFIEWTPTPENINALPEPIREYIHGLETICDPAGMVQEIALLRKTLRHFKNFWRRNHDCHERTD